MVTPQDADRIEEARIEIALTLGKIHNEWGMALVDLMPVALAEVSIALVDVFGKEIAADLLRHALGRVEGG